MKKNKGQTPEQSIELGHPLWLELNQLQRCNGQIVALDTETTGLLWHKDSMIGLGVWCPDANVYGYIPTVDTTERILVKAAVKECLGRDTTVIMHNAKFDLHFLGANPRELGWSIIDTTVPIHLLDSRNDKRAETVETRILGTDTKRSLIQKMPPKLRKKVWQWPIEHTAVYCLNDVRIEYEFAKILLPWIETEGLLDLFWKEMEYLKLLYEVEELGLLVNVPFINRSKELLMEHLAELEKGLYDAVGYEFNWRSHKQLSQALYEDMGIDRPVNPFTVSRFNRDKGKYNSADTSRFILMEKAKHPLGVLVSALREAWKMAGYIEEWLDLIDDNDCLHTGYNQTGTRTGRLSSAKPNLQNVPSETRGFFTQAVYSGSTVVQDEYNLRKGIVSRPGTKFASIDWKQMEMRMFGILSGDPFMLDSLAAGRDIHADIAEQVWNTRDPVHREWAKTISFGLIYGMTTGSLQFKLNLTQQKAQQITDDYWHTFPRIRPWLYGTAKECKKRGFVEYWSGRRWVEDKELFYFKAANALIQGGCADVLSVAALRVAEMLRQTGWGRIVNLVHDEIIMEVADKHVKKAAREAMRIMAVEDLFEIPWFTDAKIGTTYGDLQKVEV